MSVTVWTPSRLHFGLLSASRMAALRWPDRQGELVLPGRCFGGVGLMVRQPGVQITVEKAPAWSAEGPSSARALKFARQFVSTLPADAVYPPQRIRVVDCPREHTGLGTGTQLGLAVARALAGAYGLVLPVDDLARRVGRGLRSALGIHGFQAGGFLVEAGHGDKGGVAPLAARMDFPEAWRVVLVLPHSGQGLHGTPETEVLGRLPAAASQTDALCRLVLLGMLPALAEEDCPAFGEALFDFNRRVGEMFDPVQGGLYASAIIGRQVDFIRRQGVAGVGQSSWGPAVLAVLEDADRAEDLVRRLRQEFPLGEDEVIVTAASNGGAVVK